MSFSGFSLKICVLTETLGETKLEIRCSAYCLRQSRRLASGPALEVVAAARIASRSQIFIPGQAFVEIHHLSITALKIRQLLLNLLLHGLPLTSSALLHLGIPQRFGGRDYAFGSGFEKKSFENCCGFTITERKVIKDISYVENVLPTVSYMFSGNLLQ